jgi:hypothetical protein
MSSSLDSIYKKMASSLEAGGAGHAHVAKLDPARQISPVEINEIEAGLQKILSDDELRAKTGAWKEELSKIETRTNSRKSSTKFCPRRLPS